MKKITLESAATLANITRPPMVISDLIPEGSISFVAGPTYSGKTFFALEAARSVAFSQPFMGRWPVENWGNVLFIEQDSPKYDTGRALYAMLRPVMEGLSASPDGGHPLQALQIAWFQSLNLGNTEDVGRIAHTANALTTPLGHVGREELVMRGCRLIILDTFRRLHSSDENSSTEMQTILDRLTFLKEKTGAAILCIHHTSRGAPGSSLDDTNMRGSTAIEGAVDNIFQVTGSRKKRISTVRVKKARAIQPPDFTYRIVTEDTPEYGLVKRVELVEILPGPTDEEPTPTQEDSMLAYLRGKPYGRSDLVTWGALQGLSRSTIYRKIRVLIEGGLIHEDPLTGRLTATP